MGGIGCLGHFNGSRLVSDGHRSTVTAFDVIPVGSALDCHHVCLDIAGGAAGRRDEDTIRAVAGDRVTRPGAWSPGRRPRRAAYGVARRVGDQHAAECVGQWCRAIHLGADVVALDGVATGLPNPQKGLPGGTPRFSVI